MIFEGDEYLSSPIDLRPKFHWYKPHIALISGIAWDHMNVFPTFENYLDQFNLFIRGIEPNGVLIYSNDDEQLVQLVKNNPAVNSIGYGVHPHVVKEGVTRLLTEKGEVAIGLFGRHNLQNLNGARLICQQVGISDRDFYDAIGNFEGAANRLEKVFEEKGMIYFKDFAHAPSKLKATIQAVRNQYPDRKLLACFELHTYSSLNKSFLSEYIHSLDLADEACVYFNPHALTLKKLPMLMKRDVLSAFGRDDLHVFDQSSDVVDWIRKNKSENSVILMMSSGNFDGINHMELAKSLLQ
jgi:UDP-N-acetylmuramate: L-alanyl-gamma-D-glutamyl-meso-diaminopimelate ligase